MNKKTFLSCGDVAVHQMFLLILLFLWPNPASPFSRSSLLFATRIRRKQHRRTYWDLVHPRAQHQENNKFLLLVPSSQHRETPNIDNNNNSSNKNQHYQNKSPLSRAVRIYADYAKRLWNETNPQVRREIARDKAASAIRGVQQILGEEDYIRESYPPDKVQTLLKACDALLADEEVKGGKSQNTNKGINANASHQSPTKLEAAPQTQQPPQLMDQLNDVVEDPSVIMAQQFSDLAVTPSTPLPTQNAGIGDSSDATVVVALGSQSPSSLLATAETARQPATKKKKKKRRSIWFGAAMGMVVAGWVFSGNYVFTGLFSLMTVLGQLEYYRMVINTGVYPARRISVVGACSMFWAALFCPQHHQIILPLAGLYAMVWFLVAKRSVTTIPEIATTFTGMFYLGYVPSFWVRIRLIGAGREPTRLAPLLGPLLQKLHFSALTNLPNVVYPKAIHLPITTGAIFIFWTWLCLAFSDVGAYFVGKNLGKTKLGKVAPAAGATSPNKTVEGVLGGCAVSAALGMLGAWVQKWPFWALTGMAHGTLLGLIGLIGDLTASMIKRDAGIKDFGDLIPEHGGILDRVDSFVWSAPYSWLVCHTIIPALKSAFR